MRCPEENPGVYVVNHNHGLGCQQMVEMQQIPIDPSVGIQHRQIDPFPLVIRCYELVSGPDEKRDAL
jgi:hypothetical protein